RLVGNRAVLSRVRRECLADIHELWVHEVFARGCSSLDRRRELSQRRSGRVDGDWRIRWNEGIDLAVKLALLRPEVIKETVIALNAARDRTASSLSAGSGRKIGGEFSDFCPEPLTLGLGLCRH